MMPVLALLPILLVLGLMVGLRWGAPRAGLAGLLAAALIGAAAFGLNVPVLWVSQAKGLLLSGVVLAVLWPALFLFHWCKADGGIDALADWIGRTVPDTAYAAFLLAWCLSAGFEGLAGFGLPIAIVAPMLVALRIDPVRAVAAVAVGHAWAVAFGDMGIIFQTLTGVSGLEADVLVGPAGLLLGVACVLCGLAAAAILGIGRRWPTILLLGAIMSGVQYGVAAAGLVPLSGFLAGLAGLVAGVIVGRDAQGRAAPASNAAALRRLLYIYLAVAVLMALVTLVPALRETAQQLGWKPQFPATTTHAGFAFPASAGAVLRPLSHPGVLIALVALGLLLFRPGQRPRLPAVAQATWRSAGPASAGILTMVGLATLMEHTGMTQLLAQQTSELAGRAYPLFAPAIGVLGAFATGSNNNSNVMFAPLQKQVALTLHLSPAVIVAAQTSGGSLGSLLAPAKIIVGCATVNLPGQEGQVLRKTLPWGLAITAWLGLLTWLLVTLH